MKKLFLLLMFILMSACGQSDGKNNNQADITICDEVILNAVKSTIGDAQNLSIKWSKPKSRSCGVSFKNKGIDFQVDLELQELGTANIKNEVGSPGKTMTNFEIRDAVIKYYKGKETVDNLGDKATYYNKRGNFEVLVLAGDNSFIVKTINWNTRGGDKEITINVAKAIIEKLKK